MTRQVSRWWARPRLSSCFTLNSLRYCWLPGQVTLLGLLTSATVQAAEVERRDETESYEMSPLVITGVVPQSPLKVVTDPRVPRQPVPASDGADYLKTIPGFSAIRNGGVNGDPVFRGMFGSRLKLLTNGSEMLGACPGRMDSPSSYISPENFDQLTVVKGPQTVLWGPGASAATILFEREPEHFDKLGSRLDATLLAGSHGRFDQRIDGAVGGEKGYIRILANHSKSNDYHDGSGHRVPSRWDKWNAEAALGWTPDEDTLLELTVGGGDGEARYAGRSMDGTQFLRESLNLRFKRENLGEVFRKIDAQVYYNYADHVMDNFTLRDPDPTATMVSMRNPMATNVDRRTVGGRLSGTWEWRALELVAGVDAQTNEHTKRQSSYNMMTGTYTDYDHYDRNKDAELHNYGLFSELTWRLDQQQRLIGGGRMDRAEAKDYRKTLSSYNMMTMTTQTWANPSAGKRRHDMLFSGFLRYERDLRSIPATAYIGIGHAERFPDYWELFSASVGSVGSTQAFETVKPEKTTQLDFGLQYRRGPLEAWASAYLGMVNDYIMFNYATTKMGMTSTSVDNIDARIAGAELGMGYRFNSNWKAETSLAYAWGENITDNRPMPQIPPLEGRFWLTYERGNWSSTGLWRVVAPQHRVAEGQGNVVSKDFGKTSGFAVLSFNSAYRLNQHFKVSAGVDNLLDKTYSEHLNLAGNAGFGYSANTRINEPGRTWWTRVDMSF